MKAKLLYSVFFLCFILSALQLHADYSPLSILAGLNFIWNSDGLSNDIEGMQNDGTPGGLNSAPPPIAAYLGLEYKFAITPLISFAPSASLYAVQYRFEERPLPTENENRTAYIPSIILDLPFLFPFSNNKNLDWYAGAGPAVLLRWAFLESDVPFDAMNTDETLSAGDQVAKINEYNWSSFRWMYPTFQAGIRYKLETGWGAGVSVRIALPLFNAWSKPSVPFFDSTMILLSLTITPPVRKTVEKQTFLIEN